MPTIHSDKGFRFFLFTNEGRGEPRIHVDQDRSYARFSLQPVAMERALGFRDKELAEIRGIIEQYRGVFLMKWDEHVGR